MRRLGLLAIPLLALLASHVTSAEPNGAAVSAPHEWTNNASSIELRRLFFVVAEGEIQQPFWNRYFERLVQFGRGTPPINNSSRIR